MYLLETLDRTKDRLHQEKRLNDNIKTKKTFHLENERGPFVTNRRHACPPDDLLAKVCTVEIYNMWNKTKAAISLLSYIHQSAYSTPD